MSALCPDDTVENGYLVREALDVMEGLTDVDLCLFEDRIDWLPASGLLYEFEILERGSLRMILGLEPIAFGGGRLHVRLEGQSEVPTITYDYTRRADAVRESVELLEPRLEGPGGWYVRRSGNDVTWMPANR